MAPLGAETPLPRWPWVLLGLLLAGVMGAGVLWVPPAAPAEVRISLPEFTLTDQEGRTVGSRDLKGRVWVAGFIFTRCTGICPLVTERMLSLQAREPGLDLVSFTVDPDHDTPEVLKAYAQSHGAKPGRWRFLTGPREPLYRLIGQGFRLSVAAAPEGTSEPPTHSDRLALVDRRLRIRGLYSSGDGEDMGRLHRDLEALLREP